MSTMFVLFGFVLAGFMAMLFVGFLCAGLFSSSVGQTVILAGLCIVFMLPSNLWALRVIRLTMRNENQRPEPMLSKRAWLMLLITAYGIGVFTCLGIALALGSMRN